jgi:hypothetical protein
MANTNFICASSYGPIVFASSANLLERPASDASPTTTERLGLIRIVVAASVDHEAVPHNIVDLKMGRDDCDLR